MFGFHLRQTLAVLGGVKLGDRLARADPVPRSHQQFGQNAAFQIFDRLAPAFRKDDALRHHGTVQSRIDPPSPKGADQEQDHRKRG
jgi:hypothetical protein